MDLRKTKKHFQAEPIYRGADHKGVTWGQLKERLPNSYELHRRDGLKVKVINIEKDEYREAEVLITISDKEGNWVSLNDLLPTVELNTNSDTIMSQVEKLYPLPTEEAGGTTISREKDLEKALKFENALESSKKINLKEARDAFRDIRYAIEKDTGLDREQLPTRYRIDLDMPDDDDTSIIEDIGDIRIEHLREWDDMDFDYGGGITIISLSLNDEGKIVYNFQKDKLDLETHAAVERQIAKVNQKLQK